MSRLRVGIEGSIFGVWPFRVTPIVRNITTSEAEHAEWLCQVIHNATISIRGVVRGRWFATITED